MQKSSVGDLDELELRAMVPQLQDITERYKRAERIQKALYSISELSSSSSNLESLYREIHDIVRGFMPADNFFVAFYDKQDDKIKFSYFVDEFDEKVVSDIPYEKVRNGITAYILRSGETLVLTKENYEKQSAEKGFEIVGSPPVDFMGIPLKRDGETIGSLTVQSYNDDIRYSEDDLDILSFISRHIITAVDRVKHRELTEQIIQQRTYELEQTNSQLKTQIAERERMEALQKALFEISELSAAGDENIVTFYGKIHTILNRLVHAPNCYIAVLNEKRDQLSFPYFVGKHNDSNEPRKLKNGLTEYVIHRKEAVLLDSAKMNNIRGTGAIDETTVVGMLQSGNSWLGAPLIIDNKVEGVLAVQTYGASADYTDKDLDILRFVSHHISVAIERRKAQQEVLLYNKQLSKMVSERTAELDQSNRSLKKQIEQRKEIELKLIHDAHHDALTGLPNRVLFNSRLELAIASKQRYENHNYALLFIDLDRFKVINDTLGHHAGDEFLKEVAIRINHCKRSHDLLARLGGDEFVVLLDSYINLSDVEHIAQRIVEAVSAPFDIEGKEVFSGASVGIVEISSEYEDGDLALRDADAAMYHAKNLGRNRFVFFDISMRNQLIKEVALELEFRKAFKQGDFVCLVQPVKSSHDESILFYEFTLGWRRENSLITRAEFWQLANNTGLNHAVNQYLIDLAFKQLKMWQANKNTQDYKLGLTLSAEHLMHKDSYENLLQLLEWSEIDSSNLVFELTEQSLAKFPKYLPSILAKMQSLGVSLVLDNFGNQSASLTHLFKFDFDYIKLSAALVQSIDMSLKYQQLVESIILIAQNNEIQVIADGIDDAEIQMEISNLGCHYLQGKMLGEASIL
ncbi:bifunctional diguanylate cyclase/phosphodiesterase [Glaciecola sp. 1036]|uniref:bifunctional diguanylate cyclase/phosphodiesterase n=1 Tax=Alteromonadaceae TaxID=72275 RepID=UPI003D01EF8B